MRIQRMSNLSRLSALLLLIDMAYSWKAFIYYLYTGDIAFTPLKSQLKTQPSADATQRQVLALTAPPCSPKSMYRLADEVSATN